MPSARAKPKVVILGGGVASLSAAFELTAQTGWQDRFESVTVYQMGWRLGGKGASGRNPDCSQRIEEHGLHVWPGFYDNAFQMIRRCYAELARPATAPLSTWENAFHPQSLVVVEELVAGVWKSWSFRAPPNTRVPGDAIAPPTWEDYLTGALELMSDWFRRAGGLAESPDDFDVSRPAGGLVELGLRVLERMLACAGITGASEAVRDRRLGRLLRQAVAQAESLGEPRFLDAARRLAREFGADAVGDRLIRELVLWLVDRAMDWLTTCLGDVEKLADEIRRFWVQLDFAHAALRGAIVDGVFDRGFDAIDGEDFLTWLRRHGASPLTLDSALLRGLHDFVFAYEKADPSRPNLAAGAALQLVLRLTFAYKGALMWKMQAGMGDVVFAPLYEVLRRRGVRFEFFHRVAELKPADDGQSIAAIRLGRQATPIGSLYEPLVDVGGLPCWPNRPRYDQLAEGAVLRDRGVNLESIWADWADVGETTLTAGADFDVAVLGVSLAALRWPCAALIEGNASWKALIEQVKTVSTQSVQLWFDPALAQLGWPEESPVLTSYRRPLETWADMSQTLAREGWPAGAKPASVAYFCSSLSDESLLPEPGPSGFPERQNQRVHDDALSWLQTQVRPLFPAACLGGAGELNWQWLHAPPGVSGAKRFDNQLWRANVEPTERYVQSLAGTTRHRLSPNQSGFRNLYLAGDWTRTGLNVGCVEAAVMSGRQAARAILAEL